MEGNLIQSFNKPEEYVSETLKTAKDIRATYTEYLQTVITEIDTLSAEADVICTPFEKAYENLNPIVNQLKLTEESFLFPNCDAIAARNNQITALKHANNIIEAHSTTSKLKQSTENVITTQKTKTQSLSKSRVMIRESHNPEELKTALSDIMSENEAFKLANTLYSSQLTAAVESYEMAQATVKALKNHGIEATVVNTALEQTAEIIYINRADNIQQKHNDAVKDFADFWYHRMDFDIEHARIWIAAGIISFVSMIIGWIITMVTSNGWFMMFTLLGLAAALIAYVGYGVLYIKEKNYTDSCNERYRENKTYAERRKKEIDQLIGDSTLKNYFAFLAHSAIDRQVISKSYEIEEEITRKESELQNKVNNLYQTWSKRMYNVNYLPKRLSVRLLPKIIEFIETGIAADYQSAVWYATQNQQSEDANSILLAEQRCARIMQDFELRRQGRMQEEYNQKQLEEARRATAAAQQQAEAARRAEQYASEQAYNARRASELQKEIAKNAEKAVDYLKDIKDN